MDLVSLNSPIIINSEDEDDDDVVLVKEEKAVESIGANDDVIFVSAESSPSLRKSISATQDSNKKDLGLASSSAVDANDFSHFNVQIFNSFLSLSSIDSILQPIDSTESVALGADILSASTNTNFNHAEPPQTCSSSASQQRVKTDAEIYSMSSHDKLHQSSSFNVSLEENSLLKTAGKTPSDSAASTQRIDVNSLCVDRITALSSDVLAPPSDNAVKLVKTVTSESSHSQQSTSSVMTYPSERDPVSGASNHGSNRNDFHASASTPDELKLCISEKTISSSNNDSLLLTDKDFEDFLNFLNVLDNQVTEKDLNICNKNAIAPDNRDMKFSKTSVLEDSALGSHRIVPTVEASAIAECSASQICTSQDHCNATKSGKQTECNVENLSLDYFKVTKKPSIISSLKTSKLKMSPDSISTATYNFSNHVPGLTNSSGSSRLTKSSRSSHSTNSSGSSHLTNSSGSSCLTNSSGSSHLTNSSGNSRLTNSSGSSRLTNSSGSSRLTNSSGSSCLIKSSRSSRSTNSSGSSRLTNSSGSSCLTNSSGSSCLTNSSGSSRLTNSAGSSGLQSKSFSSGHSPFVIRNMSRTHSYRQPHSKNKLTCHMRRVRDSVLQAVSPKICPKSVSQYLDTKALITGAAHWKIVSSGSSRKKRAAYSNIMNDEHPKRKLLKASEEEKPNLKIKLKMVPSSSSVSNLKHFMSSNPCSIGLKKSIIRRQASLIGEAGETLIKEKQSIVQRSVSESNTKGVQEEKDIQMLCTNCCQTVSKHKMAKCAKGHGICATCLEPQVKLILTGDVKQKNVKCPSNMCTEALSFDELRKTLPSFVVDILEKKLDNEYLSYITKWMLTELFTDEQFKTRSEFATLDTNVIPTPALRLKRYEEVYSQESCDVSADLPTFWAPMERGAVSNFRLYTRQFRDQDLWRVNTHQHHVTGQLMMLLNNYKICKTA